MCQCVCVRETAFNVYYYKNVFKILKYIVKKYSLLGTLQEKL